MRIFFLVLFVVGLMVNGSCQIKATLVLGSGFLSDTLSIKANSEELYSGAVTTNQATGYAKMIALDVSSNTKLSISMDGLELATLFIDRKKVKRNSMFILDWIYSQGNLIRVDWKVVNGKNYTW